MYWGLDTISGVAVHTTAGRVFYPDTRVLGIRGSELLLSQDVTGSDDYDYEDAAPEADLVIEGELCAFPLSRYRLHRLPLADVLRLDVEALAEPDADTMTSQALEAASVQRQTSGTARSAARYSSSRGCRS